MARKRRKTKPEPRAPWSRRAIAIGVVGLMAVLVGLVTTFRAEHAELPDLDLAAMEPRVAAKLEQHMTSVSDSPGSASAWGEMGVALQAHGLEVEAAYCYRAALALDSTLFRLSYLLVHALRSYDGDLALAHSADALTLDASYAPLHLVRAELLEERNQVDLAMAHYEAALSIDDQSALAAFGAGRLYAAKGELEQAQVLLTRASELDENASAIHAALAQVFRRQGERDRARLEARLASERTDSVRIEDPIHFQMRRESVSSLALLDEAAQASESGELDRAREIYLELVELRPDDPDIRARLGDTLVSMGEPGGAATQYAVALGINERHVQALHGLGNARNMEGAYEEAERRYREVLELEGDHVSTLLNLGSLLVFRGRFDEAELLFRRGIGRDPAHFGCHRQLGELLLRGGRDGEAVAHFRQALEQRPDFGAVHASLAVALFRQGQREAAWDHARRAEAAGVALPAGLLESLRPAAR